MGPPPATPGSEKTVSFQKSILGPRPKHIIVNNAKVPVASDNEVKQFYKPLSKPGVGFSKPNFRSKTPPPRRVNNNYSRPKTPQPKRHVGRQNQPHGFPICLGVDLEPDEWIKDSGCSKHMTGNRKLFSTYKAYNGGNVIFGSNLRGNIIGKGTISNDSLKIDNVEHVDNLGFNLLSIGQICDNKCRVTFSEHDSEITKDGKVIGRGIRKKGLYVMKLGNKPKDQICLTTIDENSTLWHRRLGHANMRLIQSLASKELVRNLPKLKFDQHFCDACKIGKQAHASHKAKNVVSTTRCLELLHMDLLEILFQPMFDERPSSPAPSVSVPINSAGTPSSTTIDQDAPSPSHSPSSSALQSPCLHKGVASDSTIMENNPFAPVDNHPFINAFYRNLVEAIIIPGYLS
ncbi:retrovirus-related pol polyprotein from transposon TNT 1-94 [Tanacetum coccineum]